MKLNYFTAPQANPATDALRNLARLARLREMRAARKFDASNKTTADLAALVIVEDAATAAFDLFNDAAKADLAGS